MRCVDEAERPVQPDRGLVGAVDEEHARRVMPRSRERREAADGERAARGRVPWRSGRRRSRRSRRARRARAAARPGAPSSSRSRRGRRCVDPARRNRRGRTTAPASRRASVSSVQPPCSGWSANARLFTASHVVLVDAGPERADVDAVGPARRPRRGGAARASASSSRVASKPDAASARVGGVVGAEAPRATSARRRREPSDRRRRVSSERRRRPSPPRCRGSTTIAAIARCAASRSASVRRWQDADGARPSTSRDDPSVEPASGARGRATRASPSGGVTVGAAAAAASVRIASTSSGAIGRRTVTSSIGRGYRPHRC